MKAQKTTKSSSRKGSTLGLIMIIIVILFMLGTGLLRLGLDSQIFSFKTAQGMVARSAADAGIIRAVNKMNYELNNNWSTFAPKLPVTIPNQTVPGTNATYDLTLGALVTVSSSGVSYYPASATGTIGNLQKTVNATIKRESEWKGIGTRAGMILGSGTYDIFPEGAINPLTGELYQLNIATNATWGGAVKLQPNTILNDDTTIYTGPGSEDGVINPKPNVEFEGGSDILDPPMQFPAIDLNEEIPGVLLLPLTTISSSVWTQVEDMKLSDLDLGNAEVLNIQPAPGFIPTPLIPHDVINVYVIGDVRLHQGATIDIKKYAKLNLYVNGDFVTDNNSDIINRNEHPLDSTKKDPLTFYLHATGTNTTKNEILIQNSGDFYGVIYGPDMNIHMKNSVDFYGGVMANYLFTNDSVNYYFDVRLLNPEMTEHPYFIKDRWWETPQPAP